MDEMLTGLRQFRHATVYAALTVAFALLQASPSHADFQSDLAGYNQAFKEFRVEADAYWKSVAEKRQIRKMKRSAGEAADQNDYVFTQPPVYRGPPNPIEPNAAPELPHEKKYIPVVADFLAAAKDNFGFSPERPKSEAEFKRAYSLAAREAGLTKDQIVRIYCFEVGGDGAYDTQAGLEYDKPGAQAISTALGYNQLLTTNTIDLLVETGEAFVRTLERKMATASSHKRKQSLAEKLQTLKKMVDLFQPASTWSDQEKAGNTPLGWGAHALNLDIDIGPLLQTQVLLDSVKFAKAKGHTQQLTAAQLEMMNLAGDPNGLDLIEAPPTLFDKVPAANFFSEAGYQANSVLHGSVVAKLISDTNAKMDRESKLSGARELAAAFAAQGQPNPERH